MRSTDSLVKIGKWSERDKWVVDRNDARGVRRRYNQVQNMIFIVNKNGRAESD